MYSIKKLNSEDVFLHKFSMIDIFIQMEEESSKKNRNIWEEKVEKMCSYIEKNEGTIFAAFESGKLISFIWIYCRLFDDEKRVHINYFGTCKEYRNKGIGRELLTKVERFAKESGVNKIDLNVEINSRAVNFYIKNGFNNERIMMSKKI